MKQHLAIVAVAVLIQTTAFADGAAVQFRRSFGELDVTLFASPRPIASGLIGLSLLIQNMNGTDRALDTDVSLVLRGPSGSAVKARAIRQRSGLYESFIAFKRPGKWEVEMTLLGNGERHVIGGSLDVSPAPSRAISYAVYISLQPVIIEILAINQNILSQK
jgi:hypothetical protein